MSLVKIQGNASGTGEFTIAAPNSNTNRTLTLPDATGTIITTAGGAAISGTTGSFSGDLSFNSGYGSAAVAYGCRAWVNFNGTGTVAIRASGNVTSITDNGTGDYIVNFSTSMPDSNYSVVALGNTGSNNGYMTLVSTASGSCNIITRTSSAIGPDGTIICAAVFR